LKTQNGEPSADESGLGGKRKGKRGRDKGHRTIVSEIHFRRSEDLRAIVFPRKTGSLVDETVKNAGEVICSSGGFICRFLNLMVFWLHWWNDITLDPSLFFF
jgi:hypothetical protein